jgi:hypothetical protein
MAVAFITFDEVRAQFGLTYWEARKLLNMKGCPILPRKKGQTYKVNKDRFEEWLDNQRR